MKVLLFLAALAAPFCARADLYRWVDPQTGSVKFSSYPPPWYGDAAREASSPKVEVIGARPAAAPAGSPAKPPAGKAALDKAAAQAAAIEAEKRREELLRQGAPAPEGGPR